MEKRAQVWVETAVYILVGLTVLGILITAAVPQIQKIKDRSAISQTVNALNTIDNTVSELRHSSPGNIRIINLKMSQGNLEIDPENNKLVYKLENTRLEYSEPGRPIKEGNIIFLTEKFGSRYNIILTIEYNNTDLSYDQNDAKKILYSGGITNRLKLENLGSSINEKPRIDFNLIG